MKTIKEEIESSPDVVALKNAIAESNRLAEVLFRNKLEELKIETEGNGYWSLYHAMTRAKADPDGFIDWLVAQAARASVKSKLTAEEMEHIVPQLLH